MLKGKKAILFDAGFTLVEPRIPVAEAYYWAARDLGVDLPREEFEACLLAAWPRARLEYRSGNANLASSDDLERDAWRRFTREVARPFPALVKRQDDWLAALFAHFDDAGAWQVMPGATETLAELKERGHILGVVSNWHSVLHDILADHDLTKYVSFIVTSAEAGHKKPHRVIFEQALSAAGVGGNVTIHVGDSWDEDVEGARAVGITPVYFRRSVESVENLDQKVTEIRTLPELLG